MATFTTDWNAAFEAIPAGTDNASDLDTNITSFKLAVREIGSQEHDWTTGDITNQGKHLAGSAKAYYQSAAPTTTPGGDALGSEDGGRLWVDSDDGKAYYWDGSSFSAVTQGAATEADAIITTGSGTPSLKCKILEIGDWNMDSTASVSINHGLTYTDIRSVTALIKADSGTVRPLTTWDYNAGDGTVAGAVGGISSSAVTLVRKTGGTFDSATFDSTSYNRGYIVIWYEA